MMNLLSLVNRFPDYNELSDVGDYDIIIRTTILKTTSMLEDKTNRSIIRSKKRKFVRCCSIDGKECKSPYNCAFRRYKRLLHEAKKKCLGLGLRLCSLKEHINCNPYLDACNYKLVWTIP